MKDISVEKYGYQNKLILPKKYQHYLHCINVLPYTNHFLEMYSTIIFIIKINCANRRESKTLKNIEIISQINLRMKWKDLECHHKIEAT